MRLSLPLSLSLTHTHTHARARTHACTHTHTEARVLSRTLSSSSVTHTYIPPSRVCNLTPFSSFFPPVHLDSLSYLLLRNVCKYMYTRNTRNVSLSQRRTLTHTRAECTYMRMLINIIIMYTRKRPPPY